MSDDLSKYRNIELFIKYGSFAIGSMVMDMNIFRSGVGIQASYNDGGNVLVVTARYSDDTHVFMASSPASTLTVEYYIVMYN